VCGRWTPCHMAVKGLYLLGGVVSGKSRSVRVAFRFVEGICSARRMRAANRILLDARVQKT
jgi:predicted ATPase